MIYVNYISNRYQQYVKLSVIDIILYVDWVIDINHIPTMYISLDKIGKISASIIKMDVLKIVLKIGEK